MDIIDTIAFCGCMYCVTMWAFSGSRSYCWFVFLCLFLFDLLSLMDFMEFMKFVSMVVPAKYVYDRTITFTLVCVSICLIISLYLYLSGLIGLQDFFDIMDFLDLSTGALNITVCYCTYVSTFLYVSLGLGFVLGFGVGSG